MLKENKLYVERLFTFRAIDRLPAPAAAKADPAGRTGLERGRRDPDHPRRRPRRARPLSEELDRRFFRDRYNNGDGGGADLHGGHGRPRVG